MKRCRRCGELKELSDFNLASKNRDGRHSYCRRCQHDHYIENRVRHKANVRATQAIRRDRVRAVIAVRLAGGCVDCGNTDIRVLQFDHVSGDKIASISRLVSIGAGLETVRAEIEKCEVRCANCHAIVTLERRGGSWHDRLKPADR